jgi:hypothetical protein
MEKLCVEISWCIVKNRTIAVIASGLKFIAILIGGCR